MPRQFNMPRERRVRPITRQSHKDAPENNGFKPYIKHSITDNEWRAPQGLLCEGMTKSEIIWSVITSAIVVTCGFGFIHLFAWCVGHFMKGWW